MEKKVFYFSLTSMFLRAGVRIFFFESLKLEVYHPFNFVLIMHFIFTGYHRLYDSKYIILSAQDICNQHFFLHLDYGIDNL